MKFLFMILMVNLSLLASILVTEIEYDSGITLYGKIGTANITLKENTLANTYKIVAIATSAGLIKKISGNRVDTMISEGKIVDGVYEPKKFTKLYTTDSKTKKTVYDFDYENLKVTKTVFRTKLVEQRTINPFTLDFSTTTKSVHSEKSVEVAMANNDYLSLYLNLKRDNIKKGDVAYLDQKSDDSVALINNGLFTISKKDGGENYDILLSFSDDDLFFEKAQTKDVSFYGDAYLVRTSQRVSTIK